jgi:hypothetical protein
VRRPADVAGDLTTVVRGLTPRAWRLGEVVGCHARLSWHPTHLPRGHATSVGAVTNLGWRLTNFPRCHGRLGWPRTWLVDVPSWLAMPSSLPPDAVPLLRRAQYVLGESQVGLGRVMGVSKRTMTRWMHAVVFLGKGQAEDLARAVHPLDPHLASEIALAGRTSLAEMGLAPPPGSKEDIAAARLHLDTVVCAAAEAIDASPRAVRAALLAAFQRAREVGLTPDELEQALAPPKRAARSKTS